MRGVLTSDLLMKDIYCCVIKEGYASRVSDTRSYDSVRYSILRGSGQIFLPELLQQRHFVKMDIPARAGRQPPRRTRLRIPARQHVHRERQFRGAVSVSYESPRAWAPEIARALGLACAPTLTGLRPLRTCRVNANTLIGAHTIVSPGAVITASVIGQRCTIGPNVTLSHAYVFDDTHIDADCAVEQSIVGSGVRVGAGSRIERGCLIGDGVVLGKGARLAPFERVSRRRGNSEDEESDEEWEEVEQSVLLCPLYLLIICANTSLDQGDNTAILGQGSNAIVWPKGPSEDDDEMDEVERFNNQRLMRIGVPVSSSPVYMRF